MHKNIKFATIAFLALLMLVPASSGFGVSGAVFREDVSPGQELTHRITVSNKEDASTQNLTAKVYGYSRTIRGANMEISPENDTGSFTARPFLSVEPESFSLEPGETKFLFLNGTVPEDVRSGGRYALVAIKTSPKRSETISISTAIQVLVLLTINDGNLIQTGEIKSLEASQTNSSVAVNLILENTGNIHYRPLAQALLKDQSGQVLAQTEVDFDDSSTILPTNSYLFEMNLLPEGALSPGKYAVEGKVTLEDGTVLDSRETEIEI